jgi:FMN phosphatase YigB (HAD superfamily)
VSAQGGQSDWAQQLRADKKLYSFDLFDTLVRRPLRHPALVYNLLDCGGVTYRWPGLAWCGLRFWRVLAERLARLRAGRQDVSLFAIYRVLGLIVHAPARLLRREVALELALLQPIPETVARVRALQAEGRSCCIVSDMYLPRAVMRRIIRRHVGEFDFLVSSSLGLSKRSGGLYLHLLRQYGLKAAEVQHFGDHPQADLARPQALGIDAVLLPQALHPASWRGFHDAFHLAGEEDAFQLAGYRVLGPCALAFARFLARQAAARGLSRLVFAARDTYLLKEAFDRLGTGIETRYVRLSRRALYVASFALHGDYERFFEGRVNAVDFFARLDLDCPPALAQLDPLQHRAAFIAALEALDLASHARQEAAVLQTYLGEHGFSGELGFVDLGWRGSLQSALAELMPACRIHGFYFGSITDRVPHDAFYFRNGYPLRRCAQVFQALPLFEYLFTEPVYSLRRVRQGATGFEFDYVEDEAPVQVLRREQVAAGARQFLADTAGVLPLLPPPGEACCDRPAELAAVLDGYLARPDANLVASFRHLGHAEGFGGVRYGTLISEERASVRGWRNSYWRSAYVADHPWLRLLHRLLYSAPGMFLILHQARWRARLRSLWKRRQ